MKDDATKMQDLCREVLKELTTTGGVTVHTVHYWKRFYALEELSMSADDWDSRPGAGRCEEKSNAVLPPPLKEGDLEDRIDGSSPSAPTGRPDGYDGPEPTSSSGPLCTVCEMHSNQPGHWRAPCQWYVPQVRVENGVLRSNKAVRAPSRSNCHD